MKQYLSQEQAAKLIELGFEKPDNTMMTQSWDRESKEWITCEEELGSYSIGELLQFLPRVIDKIGQDYATINISHDTVYWIVGYNDFEDRLTYATSSSELIDAVFDMVVKLKEKELI